MRVVERFGTWIIQPCLERERNKRPTSNKVWKEKVKSETPKARPAAIDALQLTLMDVVHRKWSSQESILLKQLSDVMLQAKQDVEHLSIPSERDKHTNLLHSFEVVQAA